MPASACTPASINFAKSLHRINTPLRRRPVCRPATLPPHHRPPPNLNSPIRPPIATCGHAFHARCVSEYRQRLKLGSEACPLCRAAMPARPERLFDNATKVLVNINLRVKLGEFSWDYLPGQFRERADLALKDLEMASESKRASERASERAIVRAFVIYPPLPLLAHHGIINT